jgi:hypothetical protein
MKSRYKKVEPFSLSAEYLALVELWVLGNQPSTKALQDLQYSVSVRLPHFQCDIFSNPLVLRIPRSSF